MMSDVPINHHGQGGRRERRGEEKERRRRMEDETRKGAVFYRPPASLKVNNRAFRGVTRVGQNRR